MEKTAADLLSGGFSFCDAQLTDKLFRPWTPG